MEYSQNGQKHESVDQASTEDGTILEKLEWHVRNGREPLLPDVKGNQAKDTENDHGDDVSSLPSVGSVSSQTEGQQQQRPSRNGKEHAESIELNDVVLDGLECGTGLDPLRVDALLNGLAFAEYEDDRHGNAESDQDNQEGTKGPSEVGICVEQLSNPGTSKVGGDERSIDDAEHDDTVPQSGRVGQDDLDNVFDTNVTDPVDGVAGSVCLDVLAESLHDSTDNDEQQHDEEALDTTPNIDNLADEEVTHASDDRCDNAGDAKQAVVLERRRDIGDQVGLYGLEELLYKRNNVEAIKKVSQKS